ncbi:beta strand repeat-containing protein, partial [Helicobacter brantae]
MNKLNNKTLRGGGVSTKSTPCSSQTLVANPSRFFKPLVASSLALALGVSISSAYTLEGLQNTNTLNSPTNLEITNTSATGSSGSTITDLTLNATDGYNSFIQNDTAIGDFRFYIGATNSGGNSVAQNQAQFTYNGSLYVLRINNTSTTFTSNTNGLKMGADGSGTLKFSYDSSNNRNFTLNLANSDSNKYALWGNLELEAVGNVTGASFTGNFGGKGIKGNVTLSSVNAGLTFQNNAGIEGDVSSTKGANTLTFAGTSTITGTITTNGASASTTLSLQGNANVGVNGNITNTNGTTSINFASGSDAKTLTLGGSNNTITNFAFETGDSTNNTIILSQGTTTFGGSSLSVGAASENQALAFTLNDGVKLAFTNGLTTATTGTTTFNLGSDAADTTATEFVATITGALTNNATDADKGQVFNINAKNATLQYSAAVDGDNNGLTFNAGNNIINFANTSDGGATLSWKDSAGSAIQTITTTGGTTQINFNHSGTIAGGVETNSTNGGSTTIAIADGKSGAINGAVTTTNGTTSINFASGSNAKTLTLGGANNTLSGITFTSGSTGNIITLNNASGTTTFASAISVGASDGITFNLNGTTSTTLTFGTSGLTNNNIANFNFNKTAGKLNATSITTATTGITTFNLGSDAADTTATEFVATITGALTNNATDADKGQVFNINAKNATLQYSAAVDGDNNGLTFNAGNNIINFANTSDGGATL